MRPRGEDGKKEEDELEDRRDDDDWPTGRLRIEGEGGTIAGGHLGLHTVGGRFARVRGEVTDREAPDYVKKK